jgi:hypothetical protein
VSTRLRRRGLLAHPKAGTPPPSTGPTNTVAPKLSGTFETGQTISCTSGTWIGVAPITFAYAWFRNLTQIATGLTYTLVAQDVGQDTYCVVTATDVNGSKTQSSDHVVPTDPPVGTNTLLQVWQYDMTAANGPYPTPMISEAKPNNWNGDYAYRPKFKTNVWRSQAAVSYEGGGTSVMTQSQPWGALYMVQGENPSTMSVNLSDLQAWALYDNNVWYNLGYTKAMNATSRGNLYPEDWGTGTAGFGSRTATTRSAADGSTLVHVGPNPPAGVTTNYFTATNGVHYLFHFWHGNYINFNARVDVNGATTPPITQLKAYVTMVRAKLVSTDPTAKYVLAMASDRIGPSGQMGWDAMIGRFKIVDDKWRVFSATLGLSGITATPSAARGVINSTEYR